MIDVKALKEKIIEYVGQNPFCKAGEIYAAVGSITNKLNFYHILWTMKDDGILNNQERKYVLQKKVDELEKLSEASQKKWLGNDIGSFRVHDDLRDAILTHIASCGWVSSSRIHENSAFSGIDKNQFRRALKMMAKDGVLEKNGKLYRHPTMWMDTVEVHMVPPVVMVMLISKMVSEMLENPSRARECASNALFLLDVMHKHFQFRIEFMPIIEDAK